MAQLTQSSPSSVEQANPPGADPDCQPESGSEGQDKPKLDPKLNEIKASPVIPACKDASHNYQSVEAKRVMNQAAFGLTSKSGCSVTSEAIHFTCHRLANDNRQLVLCAKIKDNAVCLSDSYWLQLMTSMFGSYCKQFRAVKLFLFVHIHLPSRPGGTSTFASYCVLSPEGMIDRTIWPYYCRYIRDQGHSYTKTMAALSQPVVKQARYQPNEGMYFYDS